MSACPCPHYPIGCHGHPAERRAEYWKAEHLAGNERIAALSRLLERAADLHRCPLHQRDVIYYGDVDQFLRDVAAVRGEGNG